MVSYETKGDRFHVKQFTSKNQIVGEIGEGDASTFLMKRGFTIVERNVANKFGEIDIVAKKKGKTYFFEVKAGRAGGWLNPAENLTKKKLRKFFISVEYYCMMHHIKDFHVQAIIILFPRGEGDVKIEILDLP